MASWARLLLLVALVLQLWSAVHAEEEAAEKSESAEKSEDKAIDGFSEADRSKMTESSEKHEFQAEVSRLMDIIINKK
eukprot:CAMPEP_0185906500 /NCGR_PEP_ID=MMETSP0196C-20130402/5564_1 /TAXON_ID=2932 /ORGANISM="Alexandrium fundyense, Strain CCMP1719" /LENGTH=77 /DNA_ID=CAMNT_0028626257 /DNA_START=20 /DNA_END=250 /DNA_ORIENTATION=+